MRDETIKYLGVIARDYLVDGIRGPFTIGSDALPDVPSGVYIVEDVEQNVMYVGRLHSALGNNRLEPRLAEHRREPAKMNSFDRVYVLPFSSIATVVDVERLEGIIADHLQPKLGHRHPDPRRRRPSL